MSSDSDDDIGYYVPDRGGMQTHPLHTLLPELAAKEVAHSADGSRTRKDKVTKKSLEEDMGRNSYSNTELELEELPKGRSSGQQHSKCGYCLY